MLGSQPTAMMRIAIAGGGGLAEILATYISQGAHSLLILSRSPHAELEERYDCQVAVVDYDNVESLRYALLGVDVVISTVSGNEQLNLIDAARRARVRNFVPSEFEGALSHRPSRDDPLNPGSNAAIELLRHWSHSRSHPMDYTVFSCGILYERFAPGGLQTFNMGASSGIQSEGDYLVDIANATAEVCDRDASGHSVRVCMTSVHDLGQYVAAAIELGPRHWPKEFKLRGDQKTIRQIYELCSTVRGVAFSVTLRSYNDLHQSLLWAEDNEDWARWNYYQRLIQTANGRYHFREANLNELVDRSRSIDVEPVSFRRWLEGVWGSAV